MPTPASTFTVIAHRGHQGYAPENTLQAFQAALQAGFPHIETDVQLTQDGVCILLHDEMLGRTCSGSGPVAEHTWKQLADRDAGSWYKQDWSNCRVPTLDSLLKTMKGQIHLHLELKSKQPGLPAAVASVLKACGWESSSQLDSSAFDVPGLTITSFHLEQLAASKQLLPDLRHAWLIQDLSQADVMQAAAAAGVTQLCPRADTLTREAVAAAASQGFSVRAWGLKTHQAVEQAFLAGAQGGTSDTPEDTVQVINSLTSSTAGLPSNGLSTTATATAATTATTTATAPADFRSDTVTRPTPAMMQSMMTAKVGDDVWGDDPTINELQRLAADLFGYEAALFCPSGTMTNQIAIKVHTRPGDELICSNAAHIYCYEGGGIAFNSGVQARALQGDAVGRITADQVASAINADDPHYPHTSLVCIENTTNKGGGACYSLTAMRQISQLCRSKGLKLHLDGARVFNAIVASRTAQPDEQAAEPYGPREIGQLFESVSICLSKGLGCPVGSLLLGSSQFITAARRVRKVLGGGMRQAGFLAAAGIYALQHNIDRLAEDHARAQQLGAALASLPPSLVSKVAPVSTNIVIWEVAEPHAPQAVNEYLASQGVLVSSMGGRLLRLVTHLDVGDEHVQAAVSAIQNMHTAPFVTHGAA